MTRASITLSLPMPPSINSTHGIGKTRKKIFAMDEDLGRIFMGFRDRQTLYRKPHYVAWQNAAGAEIMAAPDAIVVWAVTSANQAGTRRNPFPAHRREAAIEILAHVEDLPSLVVPVVDVAPTPRFAATHAIVQPLAPGALAVRSPRLPPAGGRAPPAG